MSTLSEVINSGWFSWAVGLVGGTAISGFFYKKALREPKACYAIRSMGVIEMSKHPTIQEGVSVQYKGDPIERLTASTVTVWNGGSSVLDGGLIVLRDPLRVAVPEGCRILEVVQVVDPNPQCGCNVAIDKENPEVALINFDYLDPKNGFSFRMLHTASQWQERLVGSVKGVRIDSERGSIEEQKKARRVLVAVFRSVPFSALAIFVLVASASWGVVVERPNIDINSIEFGQALVSSDAARAGVLLFLGHMAVIMWIAYRKFFTLMNPIPESLQSGALVMYRDTTAFRERD